MFIYLPSQHWMHEFCFDLKHNMSEIKPVLHAQKSMQPDKCICVWWILQLYLHMNSNIRLEVPRNTARRWAVNLPRCKQIHGHGHDGTRTRRTRARTHSSGHGWSSGRSGSGCLSGCTDTRVHEGGSDPSSLHSRGHHRTDTQAGLGWFWTSLIMHTVRTACCSCSSLTYTDLRWSRGGASLQKKMWSRRDLRSADRRRWITGSISSSVGHSQNESFFWADTFWWFGRNNSRT